jgi:Ribbon-helix-helix protein, copG family
VAKRPSIPAARSSAVQQQEVFAQASDPLAALKTLELGDAELEELATVVKEAHNAFQSHLVSALQAALIAGRALLAAKERFVYDREVGGFRGWIADLGLSKSASYRYIELAKHDGIVSQAGTLAEAMELVSQYKAEQRAAAAHQNLEAPRFMKRRTTLTLESENDAKLEQLAGVRGIEVAELIEEVLKRWLSRQKFPT